MACLHAFAITLLCAASGCQDLERRSITQVIAGTTPCSTTVGSWALLWKYPVPPTFSFICKTASKSKADAFLLWQFYNTRIPYTSMIFGKHT